MRYYVGVDGGGTKTEFIWVNEGGMVVLNERLGSSNPNDIGKDKMIADMVAAISKNMPQDADCVDICMGLSGIGFAGCKDELITAIKQIDKVRFVDVCSDVQIALDSAYEQDGCIVIMGTGSVGYLRKNGEHILIGGCGYMIDSSLSGYDLGREVLNAVLCEVDGRGEKTLLSTLVLEETGLDASAIVKKVYTLGKAYVASFAPHVFTAYEKGDKVAKKILVRRVKEWESLLFGVRKASGQDICEITLIGGLNKRWNLLSAFLSRKARKKIRFKLPENPVIEGALRRARRLGA